VLDKEKGITAEVIQQQGKQSGAASKKDE